MPSYIDRSDSRIQRYFHQAGNITDLCERLGAEYYPLLNGRRFLTTKEASARLHISRRTLQDMIDRRMIPFYRIGGKILLAEGDLEAFLNSNYHPSY